MSSPQGASIKPASHCVEPTEKVTGGQLTTKGSVFALYNQLNEGSQNYTPDTSTTDFRGQCLSTMPRKRKRMGATPNVKAPKYVLVSQLTKIKLTSFKIYLLFRYLCLFTIP